MGPPLGSLINVVSWVRFHNKFTNFFSGIGFVILFFWWPVARIMKDGMRQVAGTNETSATKTEHIAEYLDHAMEKMIRKNAEVGVCSKIHIVPL